MISWKHKEGETPYEDDLSGFLHMNSFPNLTRQDVDVLEAENVRVATLKYLVSKPSIKKAPFSYEWFLKLHKEMYGDVWAWAGEVRKTELTIGLPANQVSEALRVLSSDLASWPKYFSPLEAAVRLHHRAVQIHPFKNGNGRWSRLLSNIWLRQNNQPVIEWPSIIGIGSVRDEYLKAVKEADNLNFDLLIEMHRKYQGIEK